jgi:hypothetical protein
MEPWFASPLQLSKRASGACSNESQMFPLQMMAHSVTINNRLAVNFMASDQFFKSVQIGCFAFIYLDDSLPKKIQAIEQRP